MVTVREGALAVADGANIALDDADPTVDTAVLLEADRSATVFAGTGRLVSLGESVIHADGGTAAVPSQVYSTVDVPIAAHSLTKAGRAVENCWSESFSGPLRGTFVGLPEGHTFLVDQTPFHITYRGGDGNDVVLTAVPEPASVASLLPALMLLRRPHRR